MCIRVWCMWFAGGKQSPSLSACGPCGVSTPVRFWELFAKTQWRDDDQRSKEREPVACSVIELFPRASRPLYPTLPLHLPQQPRTCSLFLSSTMATNITFHPGESFPPFVAQLASARTLRRLTLSRRGHPRGAFRIHRPEGRYCLVHRSLGFGQGEHRCRGREE